MENDEEAALPKPPKLGVPAEGGTGVIAPKLKGAGATVGADSVALDIGAEDPKEKAGAALS